MRAVVVTVAALSCICSSLAFAPAAAARSVVHMKSRHHVAHRVSPIDSRLLPVQHAQGLLIPIQLRARQSQS
jgi:hypothetical protein